MLHNIVSTVYPAQIDSSITLPTVLDNITSVKGVNVNILRDAILAVERTLGVKPQGIFNTVRARLDALEATLFNQQGAGSIISYGIPETGQTIIWNGFAWGPTVNGGNNFIDQNISTTGGITSGPIESTSEMTGLFDLTGKIIVNAITTSYVSDPGQGIIYFDGYTNQFLVSEDGYAYVPLLSKYNGFIQNITIIDNDYTIQSTDNVISIGTLSSSITVSLPATPVVGQTFDIKDARGSAATYVITVSGNGNMIDGVNEYIIAINYEGITVVWDGDSWLTL